MMGSEAGDATAEVGPPPSPLSDPAIKIMRAAARLLPGLGTMKPEATRVALRSIPADELSAVGPIPGIEGYYICVTHSGVTLAPVLGQAVADEIAGRRSRSDLTPFRPSRFLANAAA